jgi:divalent metal cation (Fe/Co/Zn/Cd) transporter
VLAAYVAVDAAKMLVQREPPHASIVGVCLAAVSIVVMPLFARAKRRVAARLNSRALVADSRQTDLCAYLSGILFVGPYSQRALWMVVGGFNSRNSHGSDYHAWGDRSVEGRCLR